MLMRHNDQLAPGRLHVVAATPADLDAVAAAADPRHACLRGAWFAAAQGARLHAVVRGDGRPLAGFGLVDRRIGPLRICEVAGSYWPFRSIALAADADAADAHALLADREVRAVLGRIWRLGPVFADDPGAALLRAAAADAGWSVLSRSLGTCFEIDLAALNSDGPWPRAATMKKNRWREKQLSQIGALDIRRVTGTDWREADRDAIAQIERNSWLATEKDAGLQFADQRQRSIWEGVAADPALAAMLRASILYVGPDPAAFTFGLQVGTTRYQIANNYDARFARHSPGRTLLMREFEHMAGDGVTRISWGSGDAGYKGEMGARPGPEIVDLLFVRPKPAAALLRRLWRTR